MTTDQTEVTPELNAFRQLIEVGFNKNFKMPVTSEKASAPVALSSVYFEMMEKFIVDLNSHVIESKELAESLITIQHDNGVSIGNWRIYVSERNNQKYYTIRHAITGALVAKDLYLYNAALAVVRLLNNNHLPYSLEVKTVLSLEENYVRNVHDLANYKRIYNVAKRSNQPQKQEIYKIRYDQCRAITNHLEKKIENIAIGCLV